MNDIKMGRHVIIEDDVTFGKNVTIGHNVIIYADTQIGDNVVIQDNAVIGKQPVKASTSILLDVNNLSGAKIGSEVIVGTSSIIYANSEIENNVFVADLATIRERVKIGEYTIVGRGVDIENDSSVGKRCKLETNCYITAYSELGDYVFVAPGVITTNDNFMGRSKERFDHFKGVNVKTGGRIGANATILPNKTIKEDGAVAAGSVVTRDVEKEILVLGSPARKFSKVNEKQLLRNQE